MKKGELYLNLASVPVDIAMLLLAAYLAFESRFYFTELVGPVRYELKLLEFLATSAALIPILLALFAFFGLYNLTGARKLGSQIAKLAAAITLGLFLVIVLFFFNQQLFPSRFIVLASWAWAIATVSLGRLVLELLEQWMFRSGKGLHQVVIINGHHSTSQAISKSLGNPKWGINVLKELDYNEKTLEQLEGIYGSGRLDEIIQANPELGDEQNMRLLEFARSKGLRFSFVPNFFDVQSNTREFIEFDGVPLISIKNTPLEGWGQVVKRVIDVSLSMAAMLILAPVYLIIYIAVKVGSPGPAIYPQIRGGRKKDFWFYKFRSMYTHLSDGLGGEEADKMRAELWKKNDRGGADSPFLKIKNDPRITPVGKIIRKTKLDEIPQFWNVLKGDMSLVGPRAHMLAEVERYRNRYRRMFSIKPGIFGVSQIAQMSWPDLPFEEEIRLNTYYIENWSLWLDIKILFQSAYLLFFAHKPKDDY